ncbi:hypothetical protein DFS33DRAFT_965082 [Desarmillaria ectypa]|nr:hypothetical protein DFS33DRAFT_965082 [Desarmillaria ectypa]
MMVEDVAVEYDASDSISFAILSVAGLDDLWATASTMFFSFVDNLARQDTCFERLRQAVFNELAEDTEIMVPSSSLLPVTGLRPVSPESHLTSSSPGLLESTGDLGDLIQGECPYNLARHYHIQQLWARDFWHRFLSNEDLAKRAYRALLPAEIPGVEYKSNVDRGLEMFMARTSFARPSNSVLWFSSLDSSFYDLEVEDSLGASAAMCIRKGVPSPSRISAGSWRRRTLFVPPVQATGYAHTDRSSPSRIPLWSGRVQRSGNDVSSSVPSLQPNQSKNPRKRRFPVLVPTMHQQEESGSPARRARRCVNLHSTRRNFMVLTLFSAVLFQILLMNWPA